MVALSLKSKLPSMDVPDFNHPQPKMVSPIMSTYETSDENPEATVFNCLLHIITLFTSRLKIQESLLLVAPKYTFPAISAHTPYGYSFSAALPMMDEDCENKKNGLKKRIQLKKYFMR